MAQSRKQLQFGLRRLLLWTAVAALYLGFLTTVVVDLAPSIVLTFWVIVLALLRGAGARLWGALLSIVAGAELWPGAPFRPFDVLEGALVGLTVFGAVEIVCVLVDWTDNRLRTNTDGKRLDDR